MIEFIADVEAAVVTALKAALPGVPVSTREPAPRPREWVRVFGSGSSDAPVPVYEAVAFTVEVWSEDGEPAASALASRIRSEVTRWGWERGFELSFGGESARVVKARAPRPVSYPPGERWARYTATYQLVLSRVSKK